MRALITGVTGFVGRHLVEHLRQAGDEVFGLARTPHPDLLGEITLFAADLQDTPSVERILLAVKPDAIYHLAGQSSSLISARNPWATLENNMRSQVSLLEAVVGAKLLPRILVVGSSEEYGPMDPSAGPAGEDTPFRPTTAYAVSKVGQDVLGYQYFAREGIPVVRVRAFSHTGPGQDSRFVIPSFARQVAMIEQDPRDATIRVGNLDVYRDFCDVRDMVRAYRLAILCGAPGDVYNIGRGRAIRLRDVLEDLIRLAGVSMTVAVDPALMRPADVPWQEANVTRFHQLTGWETLIPWNLTLRDTLDYWRARVQGTPVPHSDTSAVVRA